MLKASCCNTSCRRMDLRARLHRIRGADRKKAGWWNGDGARYWFVKTWPMLLTNAGKPPTLTRDGNWVFFLAGTLSRCGERKDFCGARLRPWKKVEIC